MTFAWLMTGIDQSCCIHPSDVHVTEGAALASRVDELTIPSMRESSWLTEALDEDILSTICNGS